MRKQYINIVSSATSKDFWLNLLSFYTQQDKKIYKRVILGGTERVIYKVYKQILSLMETGRFWRLGEIFDDICLDF